MKKLTAAILSLALVFSLAGCGAAAPAGTGSSAPYAGAPKIVLDGHDYFAADLTILDELPEGYLYAGEPTDAEKEYAAIDGSQYYTPEGRKRRMTFMYIRNVEQGSATQRWTTPKGSGPM